MRLFKPALGSILVILIGLMAAPVWAATPTVDDFPVAALEMVDHFQAPIVDGQAARLEDDLREQEGLAPRYAITFPSNISTSTHGTWEDLGNGKHLWRLRISSPDAFSLNLGFTTFSMPEAASLLIYAADRSYSLRAYNSDDNDVHGELWTPVVLSDDIVVELTIAEKAMDRLGLVIGSVNVGYRGFGEILPAGDRSGTCNNDVVCPEGDPWRSEIPAIGVISTGGGTFCTGFMVNNTAGDGTPYFMTANHCGISTSNDQSLVVYWNFESPNCGDQGGGSLADNQSGSVHLASYSASDFTLVLLDDMPDPAWGVTYAGWDNTSADATSAVAIHHPSTDEKSISFEYDPSTTTSYLSNAVPGDGTHVRITDWDDGTTEPGSSGSPLFDQNHRVVGQLHGGYASCTSQTSDWYGRFSVSWVNGLSNHLDASGTGATTVDTFDPYATGMQVTPGSGLDASGNEGGPFSPSSMEYTIENAGVTGFNFSVADDAAWVSITGGSGYLAPSSTAAVTVSLNAGANSLPMGLHSATVSFTNTSSGDGDTTRPVSLQVGVPSLQFEETFDVNPGWTTGGLWAFGDPAGLGGEHGNPDPNTGFDGTYVYGYNLNGDYSNDMSETHLTSTAFDCSSIDATSLKFRRWLNVEQPAYDHAYLRVSNDGSDWTTIWQNGGEVADAGWQYVEYDISAVADGASTVYLRWTMGSTDGSWIYSGWNIDNVEIWGLSGDLTATEGGPAPAKSGILSNLPNPFNPKTEIHFALAEPGAVALTIFDVSGRRVTTLLEGRREAGSHSAVWNGNDDTGSPVSSGIYFARLSTERGVVDTSKLTLLK